MLGSKSLRNELDREACRYMPPPMLYAGGIDICNRALLECTGTMEKKMEPKKTNENAAIAVLEEKLAYHQKNVASMATYVASHETSLKAIKQLEAALKKLG